MVNRAVPFQCSELIFLYSSSIRNCIAYGNEENIVSKDSPIHVEISLLLPRLLLEFAHANLNYQLTLTLCTDCLCVVCV